jgi:tape measure domain-containing protein
VSKYSADIEIAVRGGQQLDRTIKTLNRLNNSINVVTRNAKLLEGRGFNVASIENYSRAVSKAERAVRKAAEGTNQERQAITALVSAMELENRARERKNILIAREIANQRRVIATANAGVGMQGPAIPAFMRTGPSSPLRGSRAIPGSPAALAAGAAAGRPAGGGGGRLGGAISGSIIGGAFPLLFGQGAGAAAGGAVGGLVGGLAGPGGSFAGSLLGTLLGDLASKGQAVKDLAEDMGLAAEGTKQLAAAFRAAGQDADKFGAAVQTIRGIGFADGQELEAIKLVSKLTEDYGGKIDKVTAAYGNFVAKGKVGIADINKFTAQGIPILDELEKSYGKNRSQILDMAKAGDITAQALSDALVRIANRSDEVTKRTSSSWSQVWDNLKKGASTSANAFGIIIGSLVGVSANITSNIANFFSQLYVNMVNGAVNAAARIADALASSANNIAAFYKANPLAFGPARDLAVSGLEQFKQGARGTAKQLRGLTQAGPGVGAVGAIQVPGQLSGAGGGGGGGGGKSASDRAAEQAARLEQQTQERLRSLTRETELIGQITNLKELQAAAEAAGDKELQARLAGEERIVTIIQRTAQELDGVTDARLQQAILSKAQTEIGQAQVSTVLELQRLENERTKNFEDIIADLDFELKLKQATTEEAREQLRLENELQKLKGQGFTDEQIAQITGRQSQLAAPLTDAQNIEQRIGKLKDEVAELTNIGNIAITVADGIGVAFSQAFQGLISGSMSAEEALGSFFKSVGDMFVSMAAEIIAKQMTMIILQTILKALGAVGGVGGGFAPLDNAGATNFSFNPGSMLEGPGFMPRAGGGPTAAGTPYLVGERGPELFVPGSNGGVMSNNDLRSAMNSQGGGGAGSPVLNMSFESTTIGGVEYVSREQLEQAMAETRRAASRDGAQRGMTMTLDRIQNSSSTRRRIGV